LDSVFSKFSGLRKFSVLFFVIFSLVNSLNNIGVPGFFVFMLVNCKSDLVDLNLKVLNNIFFGLSLDKEVSSLKEFEVFFHIGKDFGFLGVQFCSSGNSR